MNSEIWAKLRTDKALKNRDLRLANIQKAMSGASTALLRVMDAMSADSLTGANRQPLDHKEVFRQALAGLSLLGHASHEVSMRRRENLQPILRGEYGSLCRNRDLPVTDLLFGDDLGSAMNDAKKMASIGRSMGGKNDRRNDSYGNSYNSEPLFREKRVILPNIGSLCRKPEKVPATGFGPTLLKETAGRKGSEQQPEEGLASTSSSEPSLILSQQVSSFAFHAKCVTRGNNNNQLTTRADPLIETHDVFYQNKVEQILREAQLGVALFEGGKLRNHKTEWEGLTSDHEIMEMIKGLKMTFIETPVQYRTPGPIAFSEEEQRIIDDEIAKLLKRKIIATSDNEPQQFISNVFIREKRDGTFRMILNLKKLNAFVLTHHFKMESLAMAVSLMTPNCFMASLDYKDAYYSVPIAKEHQKFLKFVWRNQLYQFVAMPQGLNCAPQKFTKCLKPAYAALRARGHVSVGYIDDSFLMGPDIKACQRNVLDTAEMFTRLGFIIHPTKSVLVPTQNLQFLGFILDSRSMTVSLPHEKALLIKETCLRVLQSNQLDIRQIAGLIGLMVASFPGVERGPLYYRNLEKDKIIALRQARGHYTGPISLSDDSIRDIKWWIEFIEGANRRISQGPISMTIESDASTKGWGCCVRGSSIKAGGEWSPDEAREHINYLELKAAFFALKSLCRGDHPHVRIMLDNTTAVSYIREMGGTRSNSCNAMAREIWEWAYDHGIWLSACHIPGVMNVTADRESRVFHKETEWKLNEEVFHEAILKLNFTPTVDLFASRSNFQIKRYVSWRPDPEAIHIDAFTFPWTNENFYAFPPFSILPRVLQKIREDRATGILAVPNWPTQSWFPALRPMMIGPPFKAHRRANLLYLPSRPKEQHPMRKHLEILLCLLSAKDCRITTSPIGQQT